MRFSIEEMVKKYKENKTKKIVRYSAFAVIASIVVFITIYNLIFPAIALTGDNKENIGISTYVDEENDMEASVNGSGVDNEVNPEVILDNNDENAEISAQADEVVGYLPSTDLSAYQTATVDGAEVVTNLDGQELTFTSKSGGRIIGAYFTTIQAVGNPKYGVTQNRWNPDQGNLNLGGQKWIIKADDASRGKYTLKFPEQATGDDGTKYDLYLGVDSTDQNKVGLQWGSPYTYTIEKGENGLCLKGDNGKYITIYGDETIGDDQNSNMAYFGYTSEKRELSVSNPLTTLGEILELVQEQEPNPGPSPDPGPVEPEGKVTGYKIVESINDYDITNLNGKKLVIMSESGKRIIGAYNSTIQAVGNPQYGTTQNRWDPSEETLNLAGQYWTLEAVNASNGVYNFVFPEQFNGNKISLSTEGDRLGLGWNSAVSFTIEKDPDGKGIYLKSPDGRYVSIMGDEAIGKENDPNMAYFGLVSEKNQSCLLRIGEAVISTEEEPEKPTEIPAGYEPLTNTVTPYSSVITLFDYKANDGNNWNENTANIIENGAQGINREHYLHFRSAELFEGILRANHWVGEVNGRGVLWGIVKNRLVNGYPELSGDATLVEGSEENLAYLFDRTENANKKVYPNVKNLLSVDNEGYFSFNSEQNYAYFNEDTNEFTVYGDWAVNYDGYNGQFFPFNDIYEVTKDTQANSEKLNHYFGMTITSRFLQQNNGYTDTSKSKPTTFEFGGDDDVWVFIDDVLVADLGGIRNSVDLSIDFVKGDVTISEVYGQESPVTLKFSDIFAGTDVELATYNGNTTLKDGTYHTLKFFYLERGGYASNLKLKYNLTEVPPTDIMKINQYGEKVEGAKFAVYAADEDWNYLTEPGGEVVSGKIIGNDINYDANSNITINGKTSKALYVGYTDIDGRMIFYNEDYLPLTLNEMESLYGKQFILREVQLPDGHRPISTEIHLFIKNGMLQCRDTYELGVLTSPTAMVTAPNNLYVALDSSDLAAKLMLNGNTDITYDEKNNQYEILNFYDIENYQKDEKGTLFAIVLKRNGRDSDNHTMQGLNVDTWDPIYGTDFSGYKVLKYEGADAKYNSQIEAVIDAAKIQKERNKGNIVFKKESSGMQTTLYNFPGKFDKYYTYMQQYNEPSTNVDPQFLVAYYWTTADSLDGATKDNTLRIASHAETTQDNAFHVSWGSTIEITDIENRIFFQKRKSAEENGEPLSDAVFALYSVGTEYVDGKEIVYYTANDKNKTKIYFEVDDKLKYTGRVGLSPNNMTGSYTINTNSETKVEGIIQDEAAGEIYVTLEDGSTYTIEPAKNPVSGYNYVGYTHAIEECKYSTENGTGHFTLLNHGAYVMREIKAPQGYRINDVEVKIIFNNTGVFANAGVSDDGLNVANGAGFLTQNFNQFADQDDIDKTLSWITEASVVKKENTFEAVGLDYTNVSEWNYAKKIGDEPPGYAEGETDNLSEAMVTYINYTNGEEGTVLDYSPNKSEGGQDARPASQEESAVITYPSTVKGEGTTRLYTEEGWSTVVMQQDYEYGKSVTNGEPEVYYDDIRYLKDVSYLYSGSTFVQVVDDYSVDVNVIKTDDGTGADTLYLDGAEFILYKLDESNKKLYYTKNDKGIVSWIENGKDNAYKFITNTNGDAKSFFRIEDITNGKYYLEEITAPSGYKVLAMPIEFVVDYIRDQDNNVIGFGVNALENYKPQNITDLTENPYYNESSNAIQYTLTIVNSNSGLDIEVNKYGSKIQDGVLSTPEALSGAKFKLYYKTFDENGEVKYYYKSIDPAVGVVWTKNESDAYEFAGENGGNSFIIKELSNGIFYLEETTIPTGYASPVNATEIIIDTSNKENPVVVKYSGDNNVTTKNIVENGENKVLYSINVINTLGYELPHAGGTGTYIVYIIGLTLFTLASGAYIYNKHSSERRGD